jgi:hypothetical protein
MAKETKAQKETREAAELAAKTGGENTTQQTPPVPPAGPLNNEKDEKPKRKMVEVPEDVLQKIIDKQEAQEKEMEKLKKDNEILREVADKGRLNRADQARADGKIMRIVRVSKLGENYVNGWKRIKDEVYTDERGVIHEDQVVEYYFHSIDKNNPIESQQMSDVKFSRNRKQEECEVISETKDKDGKITYVILTKKGLELPIDITFVN